MGKVLKKVISIILYSFAMYLAYNIFVPEHAFLSKSEKYLKKQNTIIEYEKRLSELVPDNNAGYHILDEIPSDDETVRFSCHNCHPDNPHKNNVATRAFYNMHSAKISCLTCHVNKKDKKKVEFGWFDAKGNFKNDGGKMKNTLIAPYIVFDSYEALLEKGIKDHKDLAEKFKVRISKRADIKCKSCHIKKGKLFLNLDALNYSKYDILRLRNLDEAKMYDRKEKWKYPDFL